MKAYKLVRQIAANKFNIKQIDIIQVLGKGNIELWKKEVDNNCPSINSTLQRYSQNQFHIINLSQLFGIVASYAFDAFNLKTTSVETVEVNEIIVFTPVIVAILSFVLFIIVLVRVQEQQFTQSSFNYKEFQGTQQVRKRTGLSNLESSLKQGPNNQGFNQLHSGNNDSVVNLDQHSLQLFESQSMADETDRNTYDQNMSSIKRGSQLTMNKKKLTLNLDDIENISDQDLDSVKNTSARAVTFNQFELTKSLQNQLQRPDDDDQVDTDQSGMDPNQTQNLDIQKISKDKFNVSSIELIGQTSDNIISSASSSHRRIQSINNKFSRPNNRNSLNDILNHNSRKQSQHNFNSNQVQTQKELKTKQNQPYAKLEDDQLNQTTNMNQQFNNSFQSPEKPQSTQTSQMQTQNIQNSQNISTSPQIREEFKLNIKAVLEIEYVKRWALMTLIVAIQYQSIEEKQQLELQSYNQFNLGYRDTTLELMKSSLISALLYVPIMLVLSKKFTQFKFIKILIISTIILQVLDLILLKILDVQEINRQFLHCFINGLERGVNLSLLFQLYVLGIKLVPTVQRYQTTCLYGLCVIVGSLLGSILSQLITLLQLNQSIPLIVHSIVQLSLGISVLIVAFLMTGSSEQLFRSSSSSDVLSGPQRLEQIQRQNENQEKTVVDSAVNMQYIDKHNKRWPKSAKNTVTKKQKSKKNEQMTTNPQQPSESGVHQLQEEDDTDREPPSSQEKRSSIIQDQFQKRIL
eukprot:403332358